MQAPLSSAPTEQERQWRRREAEEQQRLRREAEEKERYRKAEEQERLRREAEEHERRRREAEEQGRRRREAEEQERRRHEAEEQARRRRAAEERARRQREEEAAARARQRQELEAQATETLQTVVSGAIVTFGAGLEVQHVVTGFECCRILVRNLPLNLREEEITGILSQHGLDPHNFHITGRNRVQNRVEVAVCAHAEAARPLLSGIHDLTLRGEPLDVELGVFNGIDGMGGGAEGRSLLRLSFFAPSARFVATYSDASSATRHLGQLQGKVFEGRSLRVSRGREGHTLVINNVPIPYDHQVLTDLAGTIFLQALRTEVIDVDSIIRRIELYVSETSSASRCEIQSRGRDRDGLVKLLISCPTWDVAKNIDDGMKKYLNLPRGIRTILPPAVSFTMLIPSAQYHAQRTQWQELDTSIKDRMACRLELRELNRGDHRVQVAGTDKRAVGMLKVQAERIASGVRVPGWHYSLTRPPPKLFADVQAVGAYLRTDARKAQIKLYGPTTAIEEASALVVAELDRLAGTQLTRIIPAVAAQFFARQGVTQLRETLDNETVEYNPATRTITATGGEDLLRAVQRLIEHGRNFIVSSTADDIVCQICFDAPSAPRTLLCGHAYCTGCLRHLFGSASDASAFPLRCVGDNAQCTTLFSLAMAREFLTQEIFDNTLALAFSAHIDSHSKDFRPCTTPDCNQIYRPQTTAQALCCPSCYSTLCAQCGEEDHDGMTCEDARLSGSKDEQERLTEEYLGGQRTIKRCPSCKTPIIKSEGCNHMTCKCGVHFCWRCLAIVDAARIYDHMQQVHGGIYEPDPPRPLVDFATPAYDPFLGADYREQQRLLLEAEQNRERQRLHYQAVLNREREAAINREREREAALRRARELDAARVRREQAGATGYSYTYGNAPTQRGQTQPTRQDNGGWGCVVM
ncbi:hypothetical protein BKA62DRAFT_615521 [Auriculariales sp. MPI-PUGE-AT-0066]|nr:hypothetical protein BKA62DRAFT_615521 [Auriculariales sp. MPI-PUGE-AT-0066]